ncbi:uncharacterized protein BO66DRAFT_23795 [Aspergillus aculeatinus CBS 121060]|uniref:Uncharacterized protein n=1 Tax=Aspergillus aculeatinus CBS 121060 TaxID=1448322 RepID=A0ACD1GQY2_9EURO|nr:hypothetical protein BO66DRAFT_23795 [Aspergillus aculeatinus CBS 121060]RAH63736.1 hypothetical protein BO66DRAFT_23795 [Aspergillus aculeatinus CBS 121060]
MRSRHAISEGSPPALGAYVVIVIDRSRSADTPDGISNTSKQLPPEAWLMSKFPIRLAKVDTSFFPARSPFFSTLPMPTTHRKTRRRH